MRATNRYSCVLDAFAYISEVPAPDLISEIGHEGLELDGTPRGFHTQELIECLTQRGFSVTEIQLAPVADNRAAGRIYPIEFKGGNEARFARHLNGTRGVLLGTNHRGTPHAIAWDLTEGLDCTGFKFRLLEGTEGGTPALRTEPLFEPHTYLRITL